MVRSNEQNHQRPQHVQRRLESHSRTIGLRKGRPEDRRDLPYFSTQQLLGTIIGANISTPESATITTQERILKKKLYTFCDDRFLASHSLFIVYFSDRHPLLNFLPLIPLLSLYIGI